VLCPKRIHDMTGQIFGQSMHAARVKSLGNAVVGLILAAVAAIHAIGQAYAQSAGIAGRSGVTQVDRLLSNKLLDIAHVGRMWARFVVGERKQVLVALDWTEFAGDDHCTLAVYLITNHGRATPIAWKTCRKSDLREKQKQYEYDMIDLVNGWLDSDVDITLLADRGFGDQNLYDLLLFLGWDFVIRFRGNIYVTDAAGERREASAWVGPSGQPIMMKAARVTAAEFEVPAVVVCWDPKMKEPWCLATSLSSCSARNIVQQYGRRFRIEETFRDQKDLHFGMGLKATHIRREDRRDRLLLVCALAHGLLTLLGAAAERAGLDKYHKVNTVKYRTHSLYRQGLYWYGAIPNMRREWLEPLMRAFDEIIREHQCLCEILGVL